MSHENVDVVRRSLDAYSRRDVDVLRTLTHPDVELDWSESRSWLAGVYRGIEEALRFYEGYFEAFDEIVIQPDCFIHAGELVVVPNVAHQRGRNGNTVSARSTLLFTLRSRRIARICLYQDTDHALKAAGLAE
jgi:ketosteroid isomerase-like protein